MRHSDINLTMGTYSHVGLYDLNAAIEALPSIPELNPGVATGTLGLSSDLLIQNSHQTGAVSGDSLRTAETRTASAPANQASRIPLPLQDFEADCEPLKAHEKRATGETRTHDLRFTKASRR